MEVSDSWWELERRGKYGPPIRLLLVIVDSRLFDVYRISAPFPVGGRFVHGRYSIREVGLSRTIFVSSPPLTTH